MKFMRHLKFLIFLAFISSCITNKQKENQEVISTDEKQVVGISSIQSGIIEDSTSADETHNEQTTYSSRRFKQWKLSALPLSTSKKMKFNTISSLISKTSSEYGLQFNNNYDSCKFIGWNESFSGKVDKINDTTFRVENGNYSYWDFQFHSEEKLYMRQVIYKSNSPEEFFPYQGVDTLASNFSAIMKGVTAIAKELISGNYKAFYCDSFECRQDILFDDSTNIVGINEVTHYEFRIGDPENPSDFDEMILLKKNGEKLSFTFEIISDTLIIRKIGGVYTDPGSGFYLRRKGETKLKLIKQE